jgi:hypothetical protein
MDMDRHIAHTTDHFIIIKSIVELVAAVAVVIAQCRSVKLTSFDLYRLAAGSSSSRMRACITGHSTNRA